jgi:glycerol kinase
MTFLMALDEGTTSCRTIIFDEHCQIVSVSQYEFQQHFPQDGWVEHDAQEIWKTQHRTMIEAIEQASLTPADVMSIGITNQRETVVLWDRRTGVPVHNAIVWQDRRTADSIAGYDTPENRKLVHSCTGLLLDPYFCATKIRWMLDNVDGVRADAEAGHIAFGTIDCWLLWNLTAGAVHATDVSNACRTLLYDLHEQCWKDELLELFDIPSSILPEVRPCSCEFGWTDSSVLDPPVHIGGMIGDQQSALFGQACFEDGMAKTTYGTGCFLLLNTGEKAVTSENNLLTTIAWQIEGKPPIYALEGSVFMGGASIQWLRDGLKIIESAPEVNELAASVEDSGGVVLVPAFAGLGAPYWDPYARAAIFGLTRGSTDAHVARATLDGISCEVSDLLHAMEADSGVPLKELRVDGGAAASDLLMQIQADLLDRQVLRPKVLETTALGAAFMAGLSRGVYESLDDLASHWELERRFEPDMDAESRADQLRIWKRAVERVQGWIQEDNDEAI